MTIGVDLGGTNIRAGIVLDGTITHHRSHLLHDKESLSSTLEQLKGLIRPLTEFPVSGIGIGVPSVVDISQGIVYNVVKIPSWEEVALRSILEQAFDLPVYVNNDVNCFVLGEHRFGLARAYRSVVGITLGTGLGAGLILDNRLYTGRNCEAGEIGLLPYLDRNIEFYASSDFFEVIHGTTAAEASQAARAGDPDALRRWAEFGQHVGCAVKAALYAYDPEVIVLGGSIAKAYPFFKTAMLARLQDFAFPVSLKRLRIFQSQNEHITLLGAASLVDQSIRVA